MKRSWIKRGNKPLQRRTPLRVKGHSTSALLKEDIQALIRTLAIARDGGCVLRHYSSEIIPQYQECGGYRKDGEMILQAEHLVTRSNSSTFGNMRNIITLCQRHHIYYKPQYSKEYWDIVRKHVGEETWEWLERVRQDRTPHKMDWKLVKIVLEQEAKKLST